jgi:hypothetical protein
VSEASRDDTKEAMEARDMAEEDCYRREEWRLGMGNEDSCKIIRKYIYIYLLFWCETWSQHKERSSNEDV